MDLDIGNSPSYLIFKKNSLNLIKLCSNNVFSVSHPKGLIFLTRLHFDLSHLRELKFKHSFLNALNPICICDFDTEILNHFFLHCPKLTTERQNILLQIESISINILEKQRLALHQYFLVIRMFQPNLTPTYSIYLLTTFYLQKGLNILFLQSPDL